ncbi:MAG: NUDIX hydrolase [Deltaproteobacteria bacterium]|nr:NUDIX hydrolase [Deltaproteobacteria bacterium]
MNYCSNCGASLNRYIPPGDDRPRYVCDECNTIHYENPKIVVGCIPEWKDRILLCKRSIEPRYGYWTAPAGFLENGETVVEGARRETLEEACAHVEILSPYALFDLTHVNQVYLIFRARLVEKKFKPGHESLEVKLFREEEIPWNQIAFLSIREALCLYFQDRSRGKFPLHTGTISPGQ